MKQNKTTLNTVMKTALRFTKLTGENITIGEAERSDVVLRITLISGSIFTIGPCSKREAVHTLENIHEYTRLKEAKPFAVPQRKGEVPSFNNTVPLTKERLLEIVDSCNDLTIWSIMAALATHSPIVDLQMERSDFELVKTFNVAAITTVPIQTYGDLIKKYLKLSCTVIEKEHDSGLIIIPKIYNIDLQY